jgi:hypothetical protein
MTNGEYAVVRLSPGQHTITLTSEAPFLVAVIPSAEGSHDQR